MNAAKLGINPHVIRCLNRHYCDKDESSACRIFKSLCYKVKEDQTGERSVESYVKDMVEILVDRHVATKRNGTNKASDVRSKLLDMLQLRGFEKDDIISDPDEEIDPIIGSFSSCVCDCLRILFGLSSLYDDKEFDDFFSSLKRNITNSECFYDKNLDQICMIVDRDTGSFNEKQYDELVKACNKYKFKLYMTNPRFEFWLLLHFLYKSQIDCENVCQKSKGSKKSYLERELSKKLPGNIKRVVPFDKLVDNVDTAIENEKEFCEDIFGLKTSIGSNIGQLMTELKGTKSP